jgi:hypothetical protein
MLVRIQSGALRKSELQEEEEMTRDYLQTVRGLLAKAERAGSQAEADAFNAKANELIAKFGLEDALQAVEEKRDENVIHRTIYAEAPYAADKGTLMHGIYTALGCQTIRIKKSSSGQTSMVFGFAADLDRAELLYTSLLLQNLRAADRDVDRYDFWGQKLPKQTYAANKRAFMLGFSSTVIARVKAAEKRVQDTHEAPAGVSTALVLRDRSLAVQDAYTTMFPQVRTVKRNVSGRGFGAGQAAGQRADIGGKRLGNRTATPIG